MSRIASIVCVLIVATVVLVPVTAQSDQRPQLEQAQPEPGKLSVKVTYDGAEGPVNEAHQILVFVFDTPEFTQGGVIPIRFNGIKENGGAVEFELSQSPVYLAIIYDKEGGFAFTGPPASGSPASLYMNEPPVPAAIEITPGKTAEVALSFDDSFRVP
jgi:hypothetical protein